MSEPKVSRRQFLQMAGGLAAAAATAGGVGVAQASAAGRGAGVSRTVGRELRSVPTTCQLCQSRCGMIAYVRDGRLVKVEGNPEHPNSRGRICAKGQAAPNLASNPDRLLYPMKRVGPRGSGQWRRISWGEALDDISSHLKALRSAGHPEQFVFQAGTMATPRFVSRFLDSFGTTSVFTANPNTDTNKRLALKRMWGAEEGISDVERSKFILNFGSNPYEANWYHVPMVERLVSTRCENGARLVTFDVRLSKTAGKSDEWYVVNPGTDGLLALSMANVIMGEHLHDEAFLRRWTNVDPEELARHLARYRPEATANETGVAAEDVRRIARQFASAKPATTVSGAGISMRQNGVQNERCIFLLNAITGNIDVPGGYCLPVSFALIEPEPSPPSLLTKESGIGPTVSPHVVLSMVRDGGVKAGVYMTYMFNPAYSNADSGDSAKVLEDERLVPYFVAVDVVLSESASLADLVLPDTTFLERWDIESGPSFDMVPFVSLRQPVVSSPGESAPFHDVCTELGRRIGGGMERFAAYRNAQEYLGAVAAGIPGLRAAGGLDYLKAHGAWWDKKAAPSYRSYESKGFATASRRLEISVGEAEAGAGPALPYYQPVEGYQSAGGDHFYLVTFKYGALTSSLATSKWLSEIEHGNVMLMNTEAARSQGIKNGDVVEVKSGTGSIVKRVRTTEGIHPRVVASAIGTGHWGMGRIAQAKVFESDDADTRLIWWKPGRDGPVVNSVIPLIYDATGLGQAWHDTVVSVRKLSAEALS